MHRDARYAAELARESYRYYYLLRYPFDADEWGRPKRTSALHTRMQDLGAVFGAKHGWERPEHFEPGRPWRRAGADQRRFGWTRPPWFDRLAEEHRAFRERAGIIDMSSFGKIELHGPGALPLLERAAGNLIDRPVGSVVYTQLLEKHGGVAADVTVTRLGEERFRVVTGAGYVNSDLGWLRLQRHLNDPTVAIREITEELAVVGMWGPHARAILGQVTRDDVSEAGFPFMQARQIRIAGAAVFAQRVTYVGELGWELYVDPAWAGQVWDRLMAAGREFGITPGRLPRARLAADGDGLPLLRHRPGACWTTRSRPGLGFCVDREKWPSINRDITRRLRTLAIGGEDYLTVYGGEAVHAGGSVVGRLRSCAYGFTVRKNLAYSYLPVELKPGATVEVEVFGDRVPATVMPDAVLAKKSAVPTS